MKHHGWTFPQGLLWLSLVLGLAALVGELAQAVSGRHARDAYACLETERPLEAWKASRAALKWYPYNVKAQYYQLVSLKRLNRWASLAESARHDAAWQPDLAALNKLLAEASWKTNQDTEAAQAVMASLWNTPTPRESPAQIWRLAMLAGNQAWGSLDPRPVAAAIRMQVLIGRDATLRVSDRRAALQEASRILQAAGAPLTAQALGEEGKSPEAAPPRPPGR